jgi:hypothetical protein
MDQQKVQQAVSNIVDTIRSKGWKYTKTTKKALKELDDLGLTSHVSGRDLPCAEIVNEIIRQAKQAGGAKVAESGWNAGGDGWSLTSMTAASELYKALHAAEKNTMDRGQTAFSVTPLDTEYNDVPTGWVIARPLADFIKDNQLEVVEETSDHMTVRSEWGNGEGYDTHLIEVGR